MHKFACKLVNLPKYGVRDISYGRVKIRNTLKAEKIAFLKNYKFYSIESVNKGTASFLIHVRLGILLRFKAETLPLTHLVYTLRSVLEAIVLTKLYSWVITFPHWGGARFPGLHEESATLRDAMCNRHDVEDEGAVVWKESHASYFSALLLT